jgi:hypothetical protein
VRASLDRIGLQVTWDRQSLDTDPCGLAREFLGLASPARTHAVLA